MTTRDREPSGRRYGRFFRADPVRDVDEELEFHLAMRVEEFQRAGMTADEARAAVMQRLGRSSRILGFAIVLANTLALGIGATAAVFSVAYGVLLRPLPYRNADELVRVWSKNARRGLEFFSVAPADYLDWKREARGFSAMAAYERQRDATRHRWCARGDLRRGGHARPVSTARRAAGCRSLASSD
jgi:hypothetical protein